MAKRSFEEQKHVGAQVLVGWEAVEIWCGKRWNFFHKPAINLSCGILLGWDVDSVQVMDIFKGRFSISLVCKWKADSFEWAFIGVYGSQNATSRSLMWLEWSLL